MATPTEAQIQDQFGKINQILIELIGHTSEDANNFLTREDALTQVFNGDFTPEAAAGMAAFRAALDAALGSGPGMLSPHLSNYAKFIDAPEDDPQLQFGRLYDNFIAGSKTVKSRDINHGTPTEDGGNVGDGAISRLVVDENNFEIENINLDSKIATVRADENVTGGNKHKEVFEFRGGNAGKDLLQLTGSGTIKAIRAVDAGDSFMLNSSFSDFTGAAATPTAINNWTFETGTVADVLVDLVNFFKDTQGITTSAALQLKDNIKITQKLSLTNRKLRPNVPHYLQIAFNRSIGSGDGNLTIRMGSQSVTVALVAQSGYTILRIPLTQVLWYKNFFEADLNIEIELDSRTTGTTLIDELVFVEMQLFDGTWYLPVGGATKWRRDDFFTWADALVGSDSINQRAFVRVFGRFLPHTTGVATWLDAT